MSLASGVDVHGAGRGGELRSPQLQPGGYAAWKPRMEVFLQHQGAQGVHLRVCTSKQWLRMSNNVRQWQEEELEAALAATGCGAASDDDADAEGGLAVGSGEEEKSGSKAVKQEASQAGTKLQQEKERGLVRAIVERSTRAYGRIYAALPDGLALQVAHIPQGFAYGMWHWLEEKFQSTDEDNVDTLLDEWHALAQTPGESFDAFRARVNSVQTLLAHAGEKPSARMYAHTLLSRLQPQYKAAVLVLKSGGQLKATTTTGKDGKTMMMEVNWDKITAFINSHERSEQRLERGEDGLSVGASHTAMVVTGRGTWRDGSKMSRYSKDTSMELGVTSHDGERQRGTDNDDGIASGRPRTFKDIQCYNCREYGHVANLCDKPPRACMKTQQRAGGAGDYNDGGRKGEESVSKATVMKHRGSFDYSSDDGLDAGVSSQHHHVRCVGEVLQTESDSEAEAACNSYRGTKGGQPRWAY